MDNLDRRYYLLGLRIIADFGASIAVPVVALSYLGKRADLALGTWPWLTVAGFSAAAAFTYLLIRRKARAYARSYQALLEEERSRKPRA